MHPHLLHLCGLWVARKIDLKPTRIANVNKPIRDADVNNGDFPCYQKTKE